MSLRRCLARWPQSAHFAIATAGVLAWPGSTPDSLTAQSLADVAQTVEIRRTDFGVPHILSSTLQGAGFGLAYAQAEDHGDPVFAALIEARGELSTVRPSEEARQSDFLSRLSYQRARDTWDQLSPELREFMDGFAQGVNWFLELNPQENPGGKRWSFAGVDVHALHIGTWNLRLQRRFLEEVMRTGAVPSEGTPEPHPEDGSNAWALSPSRARNGHAILLRNPHLSWDAGYYEAHLRVPDLLDFYGDFRIGGLFGIVAGFNPSLGWSTTNNSPDLDEIYSLDLVPELPNHYRFDGGAVPISTLTVTIQEADITQLDPYGAEGASPSLTDVTADFEFTPLGPVIHRTGDRIYVMRSTNFGEWRRAEQLFAMMRSESLDEWKSAMRMQAISASNYTYADRSGNIFYVWNAKLPVLPHPNQDIAPVPARSTADVWTELVPFDELPQLLNPDGGYLRNENDPPFLTNLNEPLDRGRFPPALPEPRLRLRSQHSLDLLHNDRLFTLEEVVEAKHSPRMLLAERVKSDLVHAVGVSDADQEIRDAALLVDQWDGTASPESRGAVLFEVWWRQYQAMTDSTSWFREPWAPDRATDTPRGIGSLVAALEAFTWAVGETRARYGAWDVAWGDVHRVRVGSVDMPASGCPGDLGCFRVLSFQKEEDGALAANRGDGWVLAVEFADVPRAYSVLAYGQSPRPGSPHLDDQARLFATNRMKPVAFTEEDIERLLLGRYHPGEEQIAR